MNDNEMITDKKGLVEKRRIFWTISWTKIKSYSRKSLSFKGVNFCSLYFLTINDKEPKGSIQPEVYVNFP